MYQHERVRCNSKLSCAQFVLLLTAMGLKKEAHGRNGKRLLQGDLQALYWQHHVDVPVPADADNTNAGTRAPNTDNTNNADTRAPAPNTDNSDSDSDTIPEWDCSGEEMERNSESVPFSVGNKLKVFWPGPKCWYEGVVTGVDQCDETYAVHYQYDNETFWHDLSWRAQLLE